MNIKITKNKIAAAVFILCILIGAWFFGGSNSGKRDTHESSAVMTTMSGNTALSNSTSIPENPKNLKEQKEQKAEPEKTAGVTEGQLAKPNETSSSAQAQGKTVKNGTTKRSDTDTYAQKPISSPSVSTNSKTSKDKYLTDPIPSGKPKPVEPQDVKITDKEYSCTLSVVCKTILDNRDKFNKDKLEVLPKDGVVFPAKKVTFYEGESVFNVLQREMKKAGIHMEFEATPIYNSNYIEGINNIYEFDCGELSGWMYKVNGWFPNYGCSRYLLKNGDLVEWIYTCDLGRDIGGEMAEGGKK